jgi:hypothetical protein
LTIGAQISVPFMRARALAWRTRRMISMPLISSPWIAALRNSTGPSWRPWITCTGNDIGVYGDCPGRRRDRVSRLPGAMRWSPISKSARRVAAI